MQAQVDAHAEFRRRRAEKRKEGVKNPRRRAEHHGAFPEMGKAS
jgi:hypothetical protein